MKTVRPALVVALLACLPILGACSPGQSSSGGIASAIDNSISSALDKAQTELRTQPITVSHGDSGLPTAKITPDGNFIIAGKTVAITPEQRNALLEYRKQLVAVAAQGIAIGKQGAQLGINAAGTAIAAALSGKSDEEIQKQVESQTSGIRQAAAKICDRLPALMSEQQKLAAVLPAFKRYATMTQQDVTDCRNDALHDDDDD